MRTNTTGSRIGYNQLLFPAFMAAASLLACACNAQSDGGAGQDGDDANGGVNRSSDVCPVDFQIQPVRIDGSSLEFDASDFAFLKNPALTITGIRLNVEFKGSPHKADHQPTLDLDGIQGTSSEGFNYFSDDGYDSDRDSHESHFRLDRMRLNGADQLEDMISRIIAGHGVIRITLHGNPSLFASESIEVMGTSPCASPTPVPTSSGTPAPSPTPTPTTQPSSSPTPAPVPPTTQIVSVSPTGSPVNSSTISFTLGSNQVGVTYQCSLDGSSPALCTSPVTYSSLANGSHTFSAAATSSAGLLDPVGASYSWDVDTSAPTVTLLNTSQLPTLTNATTISFQFTGTDSTTVSFQCSLDNAASAPCASPMSYSGLAQGTHLFSVSAVDAAGNVSTAPATYQWVVDLTPPNTSFTAISPSQSITNSTTLSLTFGADKTATFACSLDGAAFSACTSPVLLSNLAEGQHAFQVQATDLAGNTGLPASYSWTVDLTPPSIALGQVIPPPTLENNATSISVEFSASEQSSFVCTFDGLAQSCTSPFTTAVSAEGNHELQIVATDLAGNASAPTTLDWVMDYTLPQIAWGAFVPSAASYINSSSFSAEVTASEAVTLACTLNQATLSQNASPVQLTGLAEGPYTLAVTGTDPAGNVSNALTHSFTVDLTPPIAAISAQYGSGVTNQTTNQVTFSANETSSFQCNQDGMGFAACVSPVALSGLAEGTHTFQVQPTDLAGNVGAAVSVSWTVDLTPPVTTVTVTQTANASFTISLSANEAITGFDCSLDGAPWSSCPSALTENNLTPGNHTFAARATDIAGNVDNVGTTVTLPALGPITTSILSESPAQNQTGLTTMSITFAASQPGGTFNCSLDSAQPAACTSPVSYSSLSQGSHTFSVWAIDRYGNGDPTGASYAWTINSTPPVTSLVSETPSASPNNSTTISIAFGSNMAGSTFTCSLDGGTAAACSSPQAYSGLGNGSHSFKVIAISPAGVADATGATYSWSVDTTPPQITSVAVSQVTGSSAVVTWTTDKASTSSVVYGLGGNLSHSTAVNSTLTTTHSVQVTGLSALTIYSFAAVSTDSVGNTAQSATGTFKTTR